MHGMTINQSLILILPMLLSVTPSQNNSKCLFWTRRQSNVGRARSSARISQSAQIPTKDYDAAEAHYKLIKDHLEAQEAICKERQRIVKQRAASSPSDVDMQDSGSLDIAPDYEIKKHAALIRVFNYKRVPVLDITTKEIDFSRVELEKKANAPTLKFQLDNVPEKEIALKVARTVIDFLKAFETYYHNFLTDDLFEDLAWRYMGFALEQIRLDNKSLWRSLLEASQKEHPFDPEARFNSILDHLPNYRPYCLASRRCQYLRGQNRVNC
ncbi:hypothetical protein BCR41DRAFT_367085 [Lobosporangium transversale]|uniref:Uncharacterized protein n=1 Tax=Lobosporangium transversale TaxID=64571 RepID=A0A1Y2H1L7_9FUNG|nr:hypothetical protein BCR41DRAFT_367085 [Lobosporangium transversale]ORZ28450.1 hypothetical protein BCR41DRAFT_367085 [Lobosporangium transversale]|eukprot:XP_021886135.1 hypothetical protein BCR41DRAFT_367085 [Lobosporangium transversale]